MIKIWDIFDADAVCLLVGREKLKLKFSEFAIYLILLKQYPEQVILE